MDYIVIDMDRMCVTHKHPNKTVVSNLSWIESSGAATRILQADKPECFASFTDLELLTMYTATCGVKPSITSRGFLIQAVFALVSALPASVANPFEADRQAASIKKDDDQKYKYVSGSFVPGIQGDLFEPQVLTAQRSEATELALQHSAHLYTAPAPQRPTAHVLPVIKGVAPPKAPRAPSTAPRSGQRETIFKVADEIWENAGKPTSVPTVLQLRKQMMVVLESSHGVKKTTSSTALGDWMKARI